jgi:alkylhydroperoxidase family enzyme
MPYVAPRSDAAQRLNIFRTMAHAPDVLQATLALDKAIQRELDPKLRELAYLRASQLNECGY